MTADRKPRVLIVGAGSMGLMTGYHLSLANAEISFLIRPHRRAELDREQILYSYADGALKRFGGYSLLTDPAEMADREYDFIVVTLDGTALRSEVGTRLVETLGEAARHTAAGIVLGSVGLGLRPWFLRVSGLPEDRVANGVLGTLSYSTKAVQLPLHAPTDANLLSKADMGYAQRDEYGFTVDDSAPEVATGFARLHDASGVSACAIKPAAKFSAEIAPVFAFFAGFELMGWPAAARVRDYPELWALTVRAVKEIQGLGIHGEAGRQAQAATTEDGLADALAVWEQDMLPLDFQGFNRFHHGGKVSLQDRQILRDCIVAGEAEGKAMDAVRKIVHRLEQAPAEADASRR
ncbi:ketopantoate reductase family protein [Sphingomonas faeni]|uniref:ketopantoate reductase family protein n=1 Tax=Sphingomonas faeni TaxID=185950 RepID=UPI002783A7AB|nr:hypothetical protein [Sphingomonas faeni]MDQ0840130.1 hypothetical protein [Sphingomonas faeni]